MKIGFFGKKAINPTSEITEEKPTCGHQRQAMAQR